MNKKGQNELASETVNALLCGMSLDSIRVYSAVVLLGFFRSGSVTKVDEAWISVSGGLWVESLSQAPKQSVDMKNSSFFYQRATVLGELYLLIGKEVSSANVDLSGALEVVFGQTQIRANSDGDDFEEIWAVMSNTPDADKDHDWYVSLDDAGQVTTKSPPPATS